MSGSQKSFEARLGRFKEGNNLIQTWLDYNPNNVLIKKITIPGYIASVETANTTVTLTEVALGNARTARHALVFKIKETNPLCLESRIKQIYGYLSGEIGKTHQATKKVYSILIKIEPRYKKKAPGTPRGAGQSKSEKTFASAPGYAQDVIDVISGLGATYTPADTNLSVARMIILRSEIIAANTAVTAAADAYGAANRARKTLYDGQVGMDKQIASIKGYLTSFSGGKKSDHYIEFSQAIKGA